MIVGIHLFCDRANKNTQVCQVMNLFVGIAFLRNYIGKTVLVVIELA